MQGLATLTDTAMPDLLNLFRCDVEQLSRALSAGGVGSIIGGVTAGIVVDRFQSYADLQLAVLLLCAAISLVAEVLACSLFFFGIFGMTNSLAWSAINVSKYYHLFSPLVCLRTTCSHTYMEMIKPMTRY